jgi:Flp pilus assembly protein TadG
MRTPFRRRDGRGQSLVEFALILPVFILVLIGLFDMGRAIYAYNTVSNAARAAARVAIVHQNAIAIQTEATDQAPGMPVTVTLSGCTDIDCAYSVTVSYDFEPVTPMIGAVFNPTISSTAVMNIESPNP